MFLLLTLNKRFLKYLYEHIFRSYLDLNFFIFISNYLLINCLFKVGNEDVASTLLHIAMVTLNIQLPYDIFNFNCYMLPVTLVLTILTNI